MELKQLRSFVTVVRTGSFSRAAEELYISQPSISTHIRQLEEELGSLLLNRNARTLELTAEGRQVFDYACSMLELEDRISGCTGRRREIRLAASTIPSAYLLPRLIAEFSARHPGVSFALTQSDSAGVAQGILERRYDLGFTGAELPDRELEFTPVCRDRMLLIAPDTEEYREIAGMEDAVERLLRFPLILREEGSGSGGHLKLLLEELKVPETRIAARVNDHEAIRNLVRRGLGVACVSERSLSGGREDLLTVPLPERLACRSLYLCRRRNAADDPLAGQFADFVLAAADDEE